MAEKGAEQCLAVSAGGGAVSRVSLSPMLQVPPVPVTSHQPEIQLDLHLDMGILDGLDLCCKQVHSVSAFPLYVAYWCATSPFSFPQIHVNPSFTQTLSLAFPAVQVSLSCIPTRLLSCWPFHGKPKEGARPATLSTKILPS